MKFIKNHTAFKVSIKICSLTDKRFFSKNALKFIVYYGNVKDKVCVEKSKNEMKREKISEFNNNINTSVTQYLCSCSTFYSLSKSRK